MAARLRSTLLTGFVFAFASTPASSADGETASAKADRMAQQLVARLTPEEKLDQLLNVAPAIPRLGVPRFNWWTESLHGVAQGGPRAVTNFPQSIALAAGFDDDLVKRVGATISVELRGRARGRPPQMREHRRTLRPGHSA